MRTSFWRDVSRQPERAGSEGLPHDAQIVLFVSISQYIDDAEFGAAMPVAPIILAPAVTASRWTCAHYDRPIALSRTTNHLIDLDHSAIMDVEASTAIRQAQVTACNQMTAPAGAVRRLD